MPDKNEKFRLLLLEADPKIAQAITNALEDNPLVDTLRIVDSIHAAKRTVRDNIFDYLLLGPGLKLEEVLSFASSRLGDDTESSHPIAIHRRDDLSAAILFEKAGITRILPLPWDEGEFETAIAGNNKEHKFVAANTREASKGSSPEIVLDELAYRFKYLAARLKEEYSRGLRPGWGRIQIEKCLLAALKPAKSEHADFSDPLIEELTKMKAAEKQKKL